jgi:hypothetical protein
MPRIGPKFIRIQMVLYAGENVNGRLSVYSEIIGFLRAPGRATMGL